MVVIKLRFECKEEGELEGTFFFFFLQNLYGGDEFCILKLEHSAWEVKKTQNMGEIRHQDQKIKAIFVPQEH